MKHLVVRFFAALLFTLSFAVLPLRAQDAATTLGLSVRFRTLKNTERMSDETRKLVEELEAKARAATGGQKYGDALKYYSRAMALNRNQPWTPAREMSVASGVGGKSRRASGLCGRNTGPVQPLGAKISAAIDATKSPWRAVRRSTGT